MELVEPKDILLNEFIKVVSKSSWRQTFSYFDKVTSVSVHTAYSSLVLSDYGTFTTNACDFYRMSSIYTTLYGD